jgi:flagellar protein FliO/FliZ
MVAAAVTPATTTTPSVAAGSAAPELGASVLQMMFGLAVVIALLFACLWLIRRLSAPRGGGAAIKILGAAAVGPRERVVLVELGEQVLVLGVAPGSVTRLHDMKRSELPLPPDAAGASAPGGKAFAAWLKQATERRNAG